MAIRSQRAAPRKECCKLQYIISFAYIEAAGGMGGVSVSTGFLIHWEKDYGIWRTEKPAVSLQKLEPVCNNTGGICAILFLEVHAQSAQYFH